VRLFFFLLNFFRANLGFLGFGGSFGFPRFETFHASGYVQEFFFAGIDRVAFGTNFNVNFRLGGSNREMVSAGAFNLCVREILGVYVCFGH
jgi:hypothetical protein